MSEGLKLVQHPATNLADIPMQLRRLAERIERGEFQPDTAVVILGTGMQEPRVFGYGNAGDSMRIVGLLQCAVSVVVEARPSPAPAGKPAA